MRVILSIILLVLVYLFTIASFHPWDIAFGLAFAALTLWLFRAFLTDTDSSEPSPSTPSMVSRLIAFPALCTVIAVDIIRGTWTVAKIVLYLEPMRTPGIVEVPIGERSRIGVVVSSIATTLSPGSLLVDIDWVQRVMLIHVLDATNPDEVREQHQRFYDRFQRHVFP